MGTRLSFTAAEHSMPNHGPLLRREQKQITSRAINSAARLAAKSLRTSFSFSPDIRALGNIPRAHQAHILSRRQLCQVTLPLWNRLHVNPQERPRLLVRRSLATK